MIVLYESKSGTVELHASGVLAETPGIIVKADGAFPIGREINDDEKWPSYEVRDDGIRRRNTNGE